MRFLRVNLNFMTDYQRMPDQNSKNQVPTALNNSDEEDVSVKKTKAVSLARAPVE